jgi:hypothetical protein
MAVGVAVTVVVAAGADMDAPLSTIIDARAPIRDVAVRVQRVVPVDAVVVAGVPDGAGGSPIVARRTNPVAVLVGAHVARARMAADIDRAAVDASDRMGAIATRPALLVRLRRSGEESGQRQDRRPQE